MKTLTLITCLAAISGCTSITFVNGQAKQGKEIYSQWHHNVAHGLYEASEPVDLNKTCQSKNWSRVTTRVSVANGLAGGVINNLTPAIDLWSPKTVEIQCGDEATKDRDN